MPHIELISLRSLLGFRGSRAAHTIVGERASVHLRGPEQAGHSLRYRAGQYQGCSVVLAGADQLTTAVALMRLDGTARRIVLYPPDLSRKHLGAVAEAAEADVILTDTPSSADMPGQAARAVFGAASEPETEWVLLTSGTTGVPKLVAHTLASLVGGIPFGSAPGCVWSTFYDIRRYGGLQIFLRAAVTGCTLVLSGARESVAEFLARAGAHGVTHISGTPSHWRRVLMSGAAARIAPVYIRLSGEIADQAILDALRQQYSHAKIVHAFASTEAGVAFEVDDGQAGRPPGSFGRTGEVETKIEGGTLRVRSPRCAARYLGPHVQPLKDPDGFVDTGDGLELRNGRYCFQGRRDGVINVGGQKVHPEEVEAVLNSHPAVNLSLVSPRRSPITGALVVADVVLKRPLTAGRQAELLAFCRGALPPHKVPAAIRFVESLPIASTGKLVRGHA